MQKYMLMQKDVQVLSFKVSDNFEKMEISRILEAERLPFHLQKTGLSSVEFEKWFMHRSMSVSRKGAGRLITDTESRNMLHLSIRNRGLSLNDAYWVRPFKQDAEWAEVSFFRNGYSDSVGNYLLKDEMPEEFLPSPDICTNGCLEKAWKRIDGKDYLFKAGTPPFYQQPLNEVLCCEIAKRVFPGLPVVDYHLAQAGDRICSACENFVTEDIEFIPASYIYFSSPLTEGETVYSHFINRCRFFGIRNVEKFLSGMIAFDYLICNQDRHFGNFGFLRNIDSGLFIGPAPIFDNGNSLWFDEPVSMIGKGDEYCKPFEKLQEAQIGLMKKTGHIKPGNLAGIELLFDKYMKGRTDDCRIERMTGVLKERAEMLEAKLLIKIQEKEKQEREER